MTEPAPYERLPMVESGERKQAGVIDILRHLILLRHGKSSWDDPNLRDFERPLKKRGRADATRMGRYLAEQGLIPDCVVVSSALRTRKTADWVCKAMNFSHEVWEAPSLYEADPDTILEVVRQADPHYQKVMVVGHNPGLEALVLDLANRDVPPGPNGKLMPTAALAVFECRTIWSLCSSKHTRLERIIRPKELSMDAEDIES